MERCIEAIEITCYGLEAQAQKARPSRGERRRQGSSLTAMVNDQRSSDFWSRIDEFDDRVDELVDQIRDNPALDRLFYTAAELGDWSLIWHLFAAGGAVRSKRLEANAVRVIGALALESGLVNGVVKSLVGRKRPVAEFERPLHLRIPRTSSFPSGHASSATMAALLLAEKDPALKLLYAGSATLVALSRSYVRIHHASDIVGGTVVGWGLAKAVKRVWPL